MKKGFKMLLMCMVVALPMLFLPYMAKAENKDVKIFVSAIPKNGSDDKHLVCGSSMTLSVEMASAEIDKDNTSIDWKVTKKDGTPMQAVYEPIGDGTELEVYAPYGYPEELEVSVCVNGDSALTDIYTFETQENVKMAGKTFFQFDTGDLKDVITCNAFTEEWNASDQTYTIRFPGVVCSDESVHFLGWKDSEGEHYVEGEKLTLARKNGFVCMSVWYWMIKEPMSTYDPVVTTGPMITIDPTDTPQITDIPDIITEVTKEPIVSKTPETTVELTASAAPELTQVPAATDTPVGTTEPIGTDAPEITTEPVVSHIPAETTAATSTPEITTEPVTTVPPEVKQTPAATDTPKVTTEPTAKPEMDKIKTVSKVTVKKAGSRKITVSWSKVSKAKGYRIAYSANKNFKKNSTKYKTTTATKVSLAKLEKNKTYYVKVCAYKVVDGKRVYGTYSNVKKIKLK